MIINYIFYGVLLLAIYKTGTLAKHHINDDNVLAVISDAVSILFYIAAIAIMYFFF